MCEVLKLYNLGLLNVVTEKPTQPLKSLVKTNCNGIFFFYNLVEAGRGHGSCVFGTHPDLTLCVLSLGWSRLVPVSKGGVNVHVYLPINTCIYGKAKGNL